jgi:hypothetical protein
MGAAASTPSFAIHMVAPPPAAQEGRAVLDLGDDEVTPLQGDPLPRPHLICHPLANVWFRLSVYFPCTLPVRPRQ